MVSDRSSDPSVSLDRILRERLEQFEVPVEVRNALKSEILAFFQRPERQPFGACVMTPEASMAADQERVGKTVDPDSAKPRIA